MSYLESLGQGLALVADGGVLLLLLAAVPIGLVMGVLPGLSGLTTLALLLPFVYGMEPMAGLAFLLGAHAVVCTGGSLTAIVLGIPGAPANAATVLDGVPLRDQGRAGYALGAALAASGLGGLIGVVALVLLLPLLRPVVLLFGAPETFVLALLGVLCIAVLGREQPVKGLIAAGLGMLLATIGYQRATGVPRFWLDQDYLLDGVRLVPLVLGLFALPEIVDLARDARRQGARRNTRIDWREVGSGLRAMLLHRALALRSALIGVLIGIVPGVGGETAPFMAYAAAKRARPEAGLGGGAIEGVIAPESSNNAKEGGALLTTLALGIPGSAGMAVLLGGFLVLGLEPGPDFLQRHMDVAIGLAAVLALANLVGVLVMLAGAGLLVRAAGVHPRLLAPVLLALVMTGAYAVAGAPLDVASVFLFGLLGWLLRALGYSRPALLLGFILAPLIETYLAISLQAHGPTFLFRPGVAAIAALALLALAWPALARRLRSASGRRSARGAAEG